MSWLIRVLDTQHNYLLRAVAGLAPEAAQATALCAGPRCTCGAHR
ncbi:hypothetical protein [Gordonia insulae]|uniref:Uncharacterized protein n=1 Tax=Gordonia insulae TaxID=2420509 RepID=A0A3G8JM96_9ACTN|nr:hypothetical protein [Gordonia insulae]AZG46186.1 hypothetical protein D7316_02787 [Gordonia insulae]